jgi:hypothetical protein
MTRAASFESPAILSTDPEPSKTAIIKQINATGRFLIARSFSGLFLERLVQKPFKH